MNERRLEWFLVCLTMRNLSADQVREALSSLEEELEMRSHLRNPRVRRRENSMDVDIEVETEAVSAEQATRQMAEEIFEAACAVLSDTAGLNVQPFAALPMDH
jgi:hypothetical protein